MATTLILPAVCAAGLLFMLRFFLAILKKDQPPLACYLISVISAERLDNEGAGVPAAMEPIDAKRVNAAHDLRFFHAPEIARN